VTVRQQSNRPLPLTDDWYREHFDHLAPQVADDLFGTLARMRSLCPVAHSDRYGGFWVITKYEDVFRVAEDWETFSSAHGLTVPVAPIAVRNLPTESDPPLHRYYKRLINPYFSPSAALRWEPKTRELVTRLIDGFIESGRCEFMGDFARIYPAQSFFDFGLNAPADEIDKVAYLASKTSSPTDPEAAQCWAGLSEWIGRFVEQRRNLPSLGDVVDAVLCAEIGDRAIRDDEIVGLLQLLVLGGLETTAGALGLAMVRLCDQPEILAQLRSQPELIPTAIEEFLRLDPPFIAEARTATRDTEISGHLIKEGEKVLMYWTSADRDEAEFPEADTFIMDRPKNRHLTFGVGIHRCAGSNLARMNMRIALEEILHRLDGLRLEDGADIHYHVTFTRAPIAVPIVFKPARRRAATK
jgi:cytochrome P450